MARWTVKNSSTLRRYFQAVLGRKTEKGGPMHLMILLDDHLSPSLLNLGFASSTGNRRKHQRPMFSRFLISKNRLIISLISKSFHHYHSGRIIIISTNTNIVISIAGGTGLITIFTSIIIIPASSSVPLLLCSSSNMESPSKYSPVSITSSSTTCSLPGRRPLVLGSHTDAIVSD